MITQYISGRNITIDDIIEWATARNMDLELLEIDSVDGGAWYNVSMADENLALEFKLTFDAMPGVKRSFSDELADFMAEEIAKEIDENIIQSILKLSGK